MRSFGSPGQYIQGNGAIDKVGELLKSKGARFLLIADKVVLGIVGDRINESLTKAGLELSIETFEGECCESEINRLTKQAQKTKAHAIISMGGGKAADTAKMINIRTGLPIIIVPTVASTDAPTSRLAVVYSDDHVKQDVLFMSTAPEMVIVDTGVIATAPLRTFIAGIGDALSTKFEAEACFSSQSLNMFGYTTTRASLSLAKLSWDIIREYGLKAIESVKNKEVSPELETVVEATILLSGLGFESGGLAAAHAIHGGFTAIDDMRGALHGELVAFGLLAQCILEERDEHFLNDLLGFYCEAGLPTTLADLGLNSNVDEALMLAVNKTCSKGSYIYNMPFAVDNESVLQAIKKADKLGASVRAS